MRLLIGLMLLFAMIGHSSANYCLCKGGGKDDVYQNALDYACGNGADCSAIQDGGPCFQPDNVKAHCDYAVNSFYQKKGQAEGTCDFRQVAAVSPNPPSGLPSGCVYPNSGGSGGTPTGTPTAGGGSTPPGTISPPGAGPTTGGTPSVFPGTTGLGPSGTGITDTGSGAVALLVAPINFLPFLALALHWWGRR